MHESPSNANGPHASRRIINVVRAQMKRVNKYIARYPTPAQVLIVD